MLTEFYSLVVWVIGGFSAVVYILEALGIYSQGFGYLDPVLVFLAIYSAYRVGKQTPLGVFIRAAAVAPMVLLTKHLFDLLPSNMIYAIISIVVMTVLAIGIYQLLGKVASKKGEAKAKPDELGTTPSFWTRRKATTSPPSN